MTEAACVHPCCIAGRHASLVAPGVPFFCVRCCSFHRPDSVLLNVSRTMSSPPEKLGMMFCADSACGDGAGFGQAVQP